MAIDIDLSEKKKKKRLYEEPQPFWKVLLRYLFSHVGLFFIVSGYAALGKLTFTI
jgi:fucose 4-O-acetylase-like acetyltransferase